MAPLACVDVPHFPLQLLARRLLGPAPSPGSSSPGAPARRSAASPLPTPTASLAVVDRDHPQGLITHLSERAYERGVRLGMRYGVALGIDSELRAGEVRDAEIQHARQEVLALLQRGSPRVASKEDDPGVFWADLRGLEGLYPDLGEWAERVWSVLRQARYAAAVVIGSRQFETYVIAKSHRGRSIVVFGSADDERRAASRVHVRHLGLPAEAMDLFEKLRVETVADFVRLPEAGILRRFGPEARDIHRIATREGWEGLDAAPLSEPLRTTRPLDDAETHREPLLFLIKQDLGTLLRDLAWRGEALFELTVTLRERSSAQTLLVRPAEPTLDAAQLAGLVHLRLESTALHTGVTEIQLEAVGTRATQKQLELFRASPHRDLHAAARALSRVRALFGEQSVVHATLEAGHLPEATYAWKPLRAPHPPRPTPPPQLAVVRRIEQKPVPLPPTAEGGPEGWLLLGIERGPVVHVSGPHVISGGWWHAEIERDYHFVALHDGAWCWVYFDRKRRRWFLQGRVV